MDQRRLQIWFWLGWVLAAIVFIAIFSYLIFGQPADFIARVEIVIVAVALVGIPVGIKYGVQDKFWT